MTEVALAYFSFWSTAIPFGGGFLPFWPEETVPTGTKLPYGTYSLTRNDMFASSLDTVRVWSRSANLQQLATLMDYIDEVIPHGGVILNLSDNKGALWITRGNPWKQIQPSDEADLRIGYINVEVRNYIL